MAPGIEPGSFVVVSVSPVPFPTLRFRPWFVLRFVLRYRDLRVFSGRLERAFEGFRFSWIRFGGAPMRSACEIARLGARLHPRGKKSRVRVAIERRLDGDGFDLRAVKDTHPPRAFRKRDIRDAGFVLLKRLTIELPKVLKGLDLAFE